MPCRDDFRLRSALTSLGTHRPALRRRPSQSPEAKAAALNPRIQAGAGAALFSLMKFEFVLAKVEV
jgi:hypothetical protein